MPVEFLTDEQEQRYGRFAGEPSQAQLDRYFYLDDIARALILQRRADHTRLGFALQLCTVRFVGTFLTNPTEIPLKVITHLAAQLEIAQPATTLGRYLERETTAREHAAEIQQAYGYHSFNEQPYHFRLVRWLYARSWVSAQRPSLLFDLTTAWLVERKILLPGVSLLTRLVAQVRDRAANRLWQGLAKMPSTQQRVSLEALLVIAPNQRQSPLDRLRTSPVDINSVGMVKALERLDEVRKVGVSQLNLSWVPPSRLKLLARYAATVRAQALTRLSDERRTATLLAFVRVLEATAQDDALDLLDQLITTLLAQGEQAGQKERMRTLPELDGAALKLGEACQVLVDTSVADLQIRPTAYKRIPLSDLLSALAVVKRLARLPEDTYYEELVERYQTVRQFFPKLLTTISFEGIKAGQPVLDALAFLSKLETKVKPKAKEQSSLEQKSENKEQVPPQDRVKISEAPREVVNRGWQSLVFQNHYQPHDRRFYTFCVLDRLQDRLRRRDVFVSPSERYGDPRLKLLQGEEWKTAQSVICRSLGRSTDPKVELAEWGRQFDAAYGRTAANLPTNEALRLEQREGKDQIILTPLDKLPESPSLLSLKASVAARLPRVDLAEVILEIAARTNFATEFTHISEVAARVEDLELSICAVLLAEACLEPLVNQHVPALRRSRLSWVQQNYIRADTIIRANAVLVQAQSKLALAQAWGGGEVASAEGLRFSVPVKTLNAGPNSKYFGSGRGITFYNFLSDQFSGIHAIVVPGTLRDAPYLLEGILEQQTLLKLTEIMSDTSGYSDIVFGLFFC